MRNDEGFDPLAALELLARHGVRFVLIGGLAGRALGSPIVTRDIDICYSRDLANLDHLAAALREAHAKLRGVSDDVAFILDAATLEKGDAFTFVSDVGAIDILGTPAGTTGYDDLAESAIHVDIAGHDVAVANVDDLIRMKRAAGRPKDFRAVEELEALRDEIEQGT